MRPKPEGFSQARQNSVGRSRCAHAQGPDQMGKGFTALNSNFSSIIPLDLDSYCYHS